MKPFATLNLLVLTTFGCTSALWNVIELDACGPGAPQNIGTCRVGPAVSRPVRSTHSARIHYAAAATNMSVYFDGALALTTPFDLASAINLNAGRAYVGFTAGTGGWTDNHSILSWTLSTPAANVSSVPEPAGVVLLGSTVMLLVVLTLGQRARRSGSATGPHGTNADTVRSSRRVGRATATSTLQLCRAWSDDEQQSLKTRPANSN